MGLRSPQQMNQVQIKPTGQERFRGVQAPQLDKTFLDVASKGVSAASARNEALKKKQLDFIVTMADNDAENDVIGANAALAQEKGLNSLDKSVSIRTKLAESFDKRKSTIPAQFHPYVEQVYAKKMTRYNKFAVPYTLGQAQSVKEEADKTYIANSMNEAIEDSGDLEAFSGESLGKVEYATAKRAREVYGDQPELIKSAVIKGVSETVRRAIEQQAVAGRFDKAQDILTTHSTELLPDDRVKALKQLQSAREDMGDKEASSLATAALVQYPEDIEKQSLFIKASSRNDKIERAATAFLRSRESVQKLAKEEKLNQTYSKINTARQNGQDPMQFVTELPPGEEREKLFKWYNDTRGGQNVTTDFDVFDKVNQKLNDTMDSSVLPGDFLDAYRHQIAPDNMKILESKFDRLKSQENSEYRRVNKLNYDLVEKTFNAWANTAGLATKGKRGERATAKVAMMEEVERILTINPKISSRELRSKALNTLRERGMTEKKVERWWGLIPDKTVKSASPSLAPDNSPRVHPSWYDSIRRSDPSLSETQINATIQMLIKNGKKVDLPR